MADTATTILGRLRHLDGHTPTRVQAVTVHDGRITDIASPAGSRKQRTRGLVDLSDFTLTAGLVDAHTHFFYWALRRKLVIDVTPCRSLDETLGIIRRKAKKSRVGDWVVAAAFDQNRWGTGFPTATDLDRAAPDVPAMVRSRDGHSVWLNTAGLKAAGITANTADPPGGCYLRDERGRPTGIVQEAALGKLPDPIRDLAEQRDARSLATIDAALHDAFAEAWRFGIAGVHSMDDAPSLWHLQRLHAEGRLGLRVVHAVPLAELESAAQLGLRTGLGDDWLRLGGIKIFSDGALGSQTAYMFHDYPGRPGFCGVANIAGAELERYVTTAARAGWAVWIHAIGDRAVHESIDAIAAARRVETTPLPHRIEHAQCVRPRDVRAMARLGITASVQPCHIIEDIPTADRHWPKARRRAYPFRDLIDAGVTVACGSDVPIESLDPRRSLFGAVCRTSKDGEPAGGWFAEQQLTLAETLHAFTRGPAASCGRPEPAGLIAPGAAADFTVWHADPTKLRPDELLQAPIAGCIIGGQVHLNDHS